MSFVCPSLVYTLGPSHQYLILRIMPQRSPEWTRVWKMYDSTSVHQEVPNESRIVLVWRNPIGRTFKGFLDLRSLLTRMLIHPDLPILHRVRPRSLDAGTHLVTRNMDERECYDWTRTRIQQRQNHPQGISYAPDEERSSIVTSRARTTTKYSTRIE